jgi:serine/threonine protein kinase
MKRDAGQSNTIGLDLCDALAELDRRVRSGEDAAAEAVFRSHPDVLGEIDAALELVYTEFVIREQLGQKPTPDDWYARFPQWREDLAQLFEVHDFVASPRDTNLTIFRDATWRDTVGRQIADTLDGAGGRRFGGYELIEEIGRGGMGVVYKARQVALNRIVALKMILAGRDASPVELQRFRVEAEAAARISHPNIVRIYDVGVAEGRPYLSLEYVDGGSLEKKLAGGPFVFQEAAELICTLALAVHDAHQHGVVHRDLKPDNVLLTSDGIPKIADFGLAKQLADDAAVQSRQSAGQTCSGAMIGTPAYMSPEQAAGDRSAIGPATDIYSLGVLLYQMLTGRPPFQAATMIDVLSAIRNQEPIAPHRLTAKLPGDLDTICLKCLVKEPAGRYESAGALAADLRRFLAGEPIQARRIGLAGQTWRWCKRKPLVASLLAALAIALSGGLAGITWQWRRAELLAVEAGQDRDEANQRRAEALEERNRALAEQERAEQHYQRARQVLDRLTQLGVDLSNRSGMGDTSRNILEQALTYYEGFLQERSDDPSVQLETGRACQRAAMINQQFGKFEVAQPVLRRGVEILDDLVARNPDNIDAKKSLADCLVNLAFVQRKNGEVRSSLATYDRTVKEFEDLRRLDPSRRSYTVWLGNALVNRAVVLTMVGRNDDAAKSLRRAIAIEEPLLKADPKNRFFITELSLALDDYGRLLWFKGQKSEGEELCRRRRHPQADRRMDTATYQRSDAHSSARAQSQSNGNDSRRERTMG